jgi:hypothetical protein
MKNRDTYTHTRLARLITTFGVGLLFAASAPFLDAQTSTVTVTGTNNGYNEAGVYTSPYFGSVTINGATVPTAMICDDYYDDSYLGESWTATATNLSTIGNGLPSPSPLLYDGTPLWGLDQVQEYMAVAYLSEEVLAAASAEQGLTGAALTQQEQLAADYGFAIWDLTNIFGYKDATGGPSNNTSCTAAENWQTCHNDSSNVLYQLSQTEIQNIVGTSTTSGYIQQAIAATAGDSVSQFSNVTIYNWVPNTITFGCGSTCAPPPQEFIVVTAMPEPSTVLQMFFYSSCAVGLFLVFRRRRPASKLQ